MIGMRGRVLVTGATGFVGRHTVRELAARGWQIDAMVRQPPTLALGAQVRTVRGELGVHDGYADLMSECAAVVHVAAFIPESWTDSSQADTLLQRNALATLRLAEAAIAAGVKRFIYVTSGNVFAPGIDQPREDSPIYPIARATYYLSSKALGEMYVEHLRRIRGLNAVILRVTSVYGPGMPSSSVVAQFMTAARDGSVLEVRDGGIPAYDLLYVEDAAKLIVQALEGGSPGVYNAGGGCAYSVEEIARAAISAFEGTGARLLIVPHHGEPVPGFPALAIDRARATWNFNPRTLAEGLSAMRAHMDGTQ